MKKVTVITIIACLAIAGTAQAADGYPLYAGQHMEVGTVTVSNDGANLCVDYQLSAEAVAEGWLLYETHWAAADEESKIPQKKGNPIPGKFPYGDDALEGVESYSECIPFTTLGIECGDELVIATHAVVARDEAGCIDFEDYDEKDSVSAEATPHGVVNFYMTDNAPLRTMAEGDTAALPAQGYPIVAEPETTPDPPSAGYDKIVAFTVQGDYSKDDKILDDNGTGAGGKTLTDPQDTSQANPLVYHAYSQGLAIVIDVSAVENVQGLDFATIDLDHREKWFFLYFDKNDSLIHTATLTGQGQLGDGVAYPVSYDAPVAKVAIFGGGNLGEDERVGYAIDQVCVTSRVDETAWGAQGDPGMTGFSGKNWATYFTYTVDCRQ